MSVRVEGGGGAAVPANLVLGPEVITSVGVNSANIAMPIDELWGADAFQIDAANPLRVFKITDVEVTIGSIAPAATRMLVGVIMVDATNPVTDGGGVVAVSEVFTPVISTVSKRRVNSMLVRGDDWLFPFILPNGTVDIRAAILANVNNHHPITYSGGLPMRTTTAWISTTVHLFLRVFHRRVTA